MATNLNFTIFISSNNQPCMTAPALIVLNLDKYNQDFHNYPFMVKLDRCYGSCSTLDNPCSTIYVANKIEDKSLNVLIW